jgi:tetratricopeptide (TPR) repeat protein
VKQARRHRAWSTLVLAIATAANATALPPLLPIHHPDTASMEPAVQAQLAAERQSLEDALAAGAAAAATALAEAFGGCGSVYAAYQLREPALACFENAARLAPADARWHYHLGVLLQHSGDFAAAAECFERTLRLRPNDIPSLLRLGDVLFHTGALDRAQSMFEAALTMVGAIASAHFGLGRIALARGDSSAAIGHFEAALARQPGASIVRYSLAQAYRLAGRQEDARRELAAWGELPVRHPDPLLDDLARRNLGSQQSIARGTTALAEKRFAAAAAAYRQALTVRPADATTWANLGVALVGLSDIAGAEAAYRQALALDAENARAHYNLGTLLVEKAQLGEGLEHLEVAASLAPDSPAMAFNLARALTQAGAPQRALLAYDRLLQLAPRDLEARYLRAQLLLVLRRYEEARRDLERVCAEAPNEAAPHEGLAVALSAEGRFAEAATQQRRALVLTPPTDAAAQTRRRACLETLERGKPCAS